MKSRDILYINIKDIFIHIRFIKMSINMIIQKNAKYDILFSRLIIKFNNTLNGGKL